MDMKREYLYIALALIAVAAIALLLRAPSSGPTTTPGEGTTTPPATASTTAPTSSPQTTKSPPSPQTVTTVVPKAVGTRPKELVGISGYLNTIPVVTKPNTNVLTLGDFLGKKVILLEFWTYASLPSQRDIPYLVRWWNAYKNKGLLVIGIHSPELSFEKDQTNVSTALSRANISYPILLDSFLKTWDLYGTKNWPRRILIDINGNIVMDRTGDGAYQETEQKIQELLLARAAKFGEAKDGIVIPYQVPPGASDPMRARIPVINLGSARNAGALGNASSGTNGSQDVIPASPAKNDVVYFTGTWDFTREYTENKTQGTAVINYGSGRVSAVLGHSTLIRFKVTLDGAPLGDRAGKDVVVENEESVLYVSDERLYEIVKDPAGYGEHRLEFTLIGNGLDIYKFIFG